MLRQQRRDGVVNIVNASEVVTSALGIPAVFGDAKGCQFCLDFVDCLIDFPLLSLDSCYFVSQEPFISQVSQ